MILTIDSELATRVKIESARNGISPDQYATQVLEEHISEAEQERREKAVALLQSWIDEDENSDEEYDDELLKMLDEDRLSERKLFPPEMKGISW